jgi:hypothetical protein
MPFTLEFDHQINFDQGESGITIEVTLRLDALEFTCLAKIDTGSAYCIFPRSIGEQLGIEIESGFPIKIGTATGVFEAFGHNVTLSTLGNNFDCVVYFAREEFIKRIVLGRFGWLDRVKLGLIDYEGKLFLSKYGEE